MLAVAWAFLKRDALIAMSYRTAFAIRLLGVLVGSVFFYYIGEFASSALTPSLGNYGGNYFAFLLIGIAFTDYLSISLATFNNNIRDSQMMGTLEFMLITPLSLPKILFYSSLWSYAFSTFRLFLYFLFGFVLFGLRLDNANVPAGLLVLLLSTLCFAGFGVIIASITMIFKQGIPVNLMLTILSVLVGGVAYPVNVLPEWLRHLSLLLPITHTLDAMRKALILGATTGQLLPDLLALVLFSLVLIPAGFLMFRMAVRRTKTNGTLTYY